MALMRVKDVSQKDLVSKLALLQVCSSNTLFNSEVMEDPVKLFLAI